MLEELDWICDRIRITMQGFKKILPIVQKKSEKDLNWEKELMEDLPELLDRASYVLFARYYEL